MDYETALEVFFQPTPPGTPTPGPVAGGRPARRLRDAYEPIAMHAVWSRRTYDALSALGLNFLTGYVWGRASGMGEPSPGVVVSTFAVFEPGAITALYEEARGKVFAGLACQPWPASPVGQLWRACDLIREHRGDSHVDACVTAGVGPVAMNILTELWLGMPLFSYSASRAWPEEVLQATAEELRAAGLMEGDKLSAAGQSLREQIEEQTDGAQQSIVDAIGRDLEGVIEQLNQWSAACVEAKAFPPDIYKRAAG
jgi:hypothetical protein